MAYLIGEALDGNDFIFQLNALVAGYKQVTKTDALDPNDTGVAYTGTGAGRTYIHTDTGAASEVITLTCTTLGGDGVAIFSVSGSVTGAFTTANITAGTRYHSDNVSIYIRTTTDWAVNDTIVFTLGAGAAGSDVWTLERLRDGAESTSVFPPTEDGNGDFRMEAIWSSDSIAGGGNIVVGMFSNFDREADAYYIQLMGATDYASGSVFGSQTNGHEDKYIYTAKSPMPFWAVCNGDAIGGFLIVNGIYQPFYLGWGQRYATPAQHADPLVVGGTCARSDQRISSIGSDMTAFWDPATPAGGGANTSCAFYDDAGAWKQVYNKDTIDSHNVAVTTKKYWTSPYTQADQLNFSSATPNTLMGALARRVGPGLGGKYEHLPIEILQGDAVNNLYMQLHFFRYISGWQQNPLDTFVDDGDTFVVLRDTFRSALNSYAAMELDG